MVGIYADLFYFTQGVQVPCPPPASSGQAGNLVLGTQMVGIYADLFYFTQGVQVPCPPPASSGQAWNLVPGTQIVVSNADLIRFIASVFSKMSPPKFQCFIDRYISKIPHRTYLVADIVLQIYPEGNDHI